jgi:hypothetical protein
MKKLSALYAALALGLVLFFLWSARLWPFDGHPDPVDVAQADVRVEHDTVRVTGTAHYPLLAAQERPGTFGRPDRTWYLFPLFEKQDTAGRFITVMVASPNKPESLASFEDLTVEGWALPPAAAMTPELEQAFEGQGYSFADDYVVLELFVPED